MLKALNDYFYGDFLILNVDKVILEPRESLDGETNISPSITPTLNLKRSPNVLFGEKMQSIGLPANLCATDEAAKSADSHAQRRIPLINFKKKDNIEDIIMNENADDKKCGRLTVDLDQCLIYNNLLVDFDSAQIDCPDEISFGVNAKKIIMGSKDCIIKLEGRIQQLDDILAELKAHDAQLQVLKANNVKLETMLNEISQNFEKKDQELSSKVDTLMPVVFPEPVVTEVVVVKSAVELAREKVLAMRLKKTQP